MTALTKSKVKCVRQFALCVHPEVVCPYRVDVNRCMHVPCPVDRLEVVERCMLEEELLTGRRRLSNEDYKLLLDMLPWRFLEEYMARRKVKVEECKRKQLEEVTE